MTTKAEVTEFINHQWDREDDLIEYWDKPINQYANGTRLGAVENWMNPEVARILVKLIGKVNLINETSQNVSNNK